jgi:deoxyribonuclease-4
MAKKKRIKRSFCLGAHMSVAGGIENAIQRGADVGCQCVQIFTKNNNQWACKPLEEPQIAAWSAALKKFGLKFPIAHASYLINLASPDDALWQKSIDALVVEWERAERLKLAGLVVHPGAYTTGTIDDGQRRIAEGVVRAIEKVAPQDCRLLLENTAGQGSCLGCSFEQLGDLWRRIDAADQLGVCFDTCHAFAAGYEINTESGFKRMMTEICDQLPATAVKALHLNDSKKGCGSRVDRHEHIGLGEIGERGFQNVFADPILGQLPGYLETPKGTMEDSVKDWDRENLQVLRRIAESV